MRSISVASCSLNQWALDFTGNLERIRQSILMAKGAGASFRVGPELEITGYGCNDHFLELDTFEHSWQVLAQLLKDRSLDDIICDIGMPVMFNSLRYNCRVLCFNGKVLLIRPKMHLAQDGNYREARWFSAWKKPRYVEEFMLPHDIQLITDCKFVPFGDAIIETLDTRIGFEICEELFAPISMHSSLGLAGVELISNGSASHHELRKLKSRMDLILNSTRKNGGVYMYANQQGCDGERLYYDGCSLISCCGELKAQGSQFSLNDVEIVTATIDLDEVLSFMSASNSRNEQASEFKNPYPIVRVDTRICNSPLPLSESVSPSYLESEQEILMGPACWLWDYLRRSGMRGFFLPLSGGIDSCSSALIVHHMCQLVFEKVSQNDVSVIADVIRITGVIPTSIQELTRSLFVTCYMESQNSSQATKLRAKQLANVISSHHLESDISKIYVSLVEEFTRLTDKTPAYEIQGGTQSENLALQNIQARTRMVLSFLLAQLIPWSLGNKGSLLVLGSSNVDEALRGYFTKYDCSSADLNPIGSISKSDLRKMVQYVLESEPEFGILSQFLSADPTAELVPSAENYQQNDEVEMGMTYEELSIFGRLRNINRLGPVGMFKKLAQQWKNKFDIQTIAEKTKRFFRFYSINRHKMTVMTPSYHAESYSPDDNRFDLRPFLYRTDWDWQFRQIDREMS